MGTPDLSRLLEPFRRSEIGWTVVAEKRDKSAKLWSPYADARAVAQRLDEVVGPENWTIHYEPGPNRGARQIDQETGTVTREYQDIMAILAIRIDGEWVEKADGAEAPLREPIKGGYSMAFRRAAVAWGIGRLFYDFQGVWLGNSIPSWEVGDHAWKQLPDALRHPDERGMKLAPSKPVAAAAPAESDAPEAGSPVPAAATRGAPGAHGANARERALAGLMEREGVSLLDVATYLDCPVEVALSLAIEKCDEWGIKAPQFIKDLRSREKAGAAS